MVVGRAVWGMTWSSMVQGVWDWCGTGRNDDRGFVLHVHDLLLDARSRGYHRFAGVLAVVRMLVLACILVLVWVDRVVGAQYGMVGFVVLLVRHLRVLPFCV